MEHKKRAPKYAQHKEIKHTFLKQIRIIPLFVDIKEFSFNENQKNIDQSDIIIHSTIHLAKNILVFQSNKLIKWKNINIYQLRQQEVNL